jgi:sporulation protein YlmC with PRC-barrel domain
MEISRDGKGCSMVESYSFEELRRFAGHEVVDVNGEPVGFVDLLFLDDETGRPEWLGVWSGVWETRPRVLVPLRGVEVVGESLRVPWTKDVVERAPSYSDEDDRGVLGDDPHGFGISSEKERDAYRHYGVEPLPTRARDAAASRYRAERLGEGGPGATR